VAVTWFLEGKIEFPQISDIIRSSLEEHVAGPADSIDAILAADRQARQSLEGNQHRWTP
jgi:1-deoxy-D-xylulose 5-phosphate reductoisomerase